MSRNIRRELTDYMPQYYGDSRIVDSILSPEAKEFENLQAGIVDVLDQMFIGSATWGLDRWEKLAGVIPDHTQTYDQRRGVLQARIRGIGTVRIELIQNLAIAYSRGDVTVTENLKNQTKDPDIGETAGVKVIEGAVIKIAAGQAYTVSFLRSATNQKYGVRLRFRDAAGNIISAATVQGWTYFAAYTAYYRTAVEGLNAHTFIAPAGSATVQVIHSIEPSETLNYVKNIQVERGKVATAYEKRSPYEITITFTGSFGIPDQIEQLKKEIRKLIPAHLGVVYNFRFYLYSEITDSGRTYGSITGKGKSYYDLYNRGF
jgi:hypothetical protein